jgi:hypothetical protein
MPFGRAGLVRDVAGQHHQVLADWRIGEWSALQVQVAENADPHGVVG